MAYKILIVEDEEIVRRELKILLENAMYEAVAVTDFENIAQQTAEVNPDLVLLDINLPGCSGYDVCMQIREQLFVPVIFLTSRTDSMDELNGILKGADDYITKPYQAPILLARIGAVLKRTKGFRAGGRASASAFPASGRVCFQNGPGRVPVGEPDFY